MAILKYKEISRMNESERKEKIKELKIELIKSKIGTKKSKIEPREIKKTIARILTFEKLTKINKIKEEQKKQKISMEICPKCGLPIQACVCEEIGKSEQKIHVEIVKRRYGKIITLVTGFKDIDMKNTAKELKQRLACGGTIKDNVIELQGNHKGRVKPILVKMGFPEESIED